MAKQSITKRPKGGTGPGEMLCTCALIRRSARRITQIYDAALKDTGLRITQYSILVNLDHHKCLSITELADIIVIDRTTLTRNLRPLQRDGLVLLSDGHDNRSKALTITDSGREVLRTAKPLWRKTERSLRRGPGDQDIAQLRVLLGRIMPTDQV